MVDCTEEFIGWVAERAEQEQGDLPAFPGVATRLVDLLEQPDVEISEIEALVSQDQVVSARVLRIANSVMYGSAMPADTVTKAVMRLGFRETAQVAMTAACRSLYSMEDRAELEIFPDVWQDLWLDSLVCAHGGRLLAHELKRGEPERVFLGSMFRNLGGLFVLKIVSRALVEGRLDPAPDAEQLCEAMDQLHPKLGADYLLRCQLPDYIVSAAAHHHDLDVPFDADHVDLHAVRLADGLCQLAGIAPFATGELGPLAEQSVEFFELDANQLEVFELQFVALAEQLHELI